MGHKVQLKENLIKTQRHATDIVINHFSEKLVYHDIEYMHRLIQYIDEIAQAEGLSDEDTDIVKMSGWLTFTGFQDLEMFKEVKNPDDFFLSCHTCTIHIASQFLTEINDPRKDVILDTIKGTMPDVEDPSILSNVLSDAITSDWSKPKGKQRIKKLYQEFLLTDVIKIGKVEWYEMVLGYLNLFDFKTDYGKNTLQTSKDKLVAKIEKEYKDSQKVESYAIKKELNITDAELKSLKKKLVSVKGRDERGIQTMFRTTSRNHYTLNQMVDRKASIMISVNAIIVSVIIGGVVGSIDTFCVHNSPILLMLVTAAISIVFAITSITPTRHHGKFTEEEVRNKQGNLLFFGNYHDMAFREYNWGVLQMMSDSDFLYTSMIRDQYFLGKQLNSKYNKIRLSLRIFLVGFVATVVLFLIVSSLPDFHFGGVHK